MPNFVCIDSHHKYRSIMTDNDVSNRTRSKADYTDQHIGSNTWSKMHNINVNNLSVQNLFFPLHDAILFQGYGKSQAQDTVRIGFCLGELYGLSCYSCDIGNAFLYEKTKEKVYITAGPEFGANSHGKNLIIDKSLYGLKTSAARFHEHLSESVLRLGFKKNKHDPDLWMVDKSSHHEYLDTYADDILIWSKDPIAVIKSLEKTYILKSVGIPKYYLGVNVESLGEAWNNQGLGLDLSEKTYIQNVIPKFEGLFGKEFKSIKTPMSEGYHPEVDDAPYAPKITLLNIDQ
jgi:hypothetical protein